GQAGESERAAYFLVDPLDGTREFIAGRDEFTINIALVKQGTPLIGIIAAPATDFAWRGIVGRGAERVTLTEQSAPTAIQTRPRSGRPVIMISRSHLDRATKAYLAAVPHASSVTCGSSIKFCRVAEGSADLYPRLAPTHDWDVAAGHALVLAAGGDVRAADGSPLVYGTRKRLIPDFIAGADPRKGCSPAGSARATGASRTRRGPNGFCKSFRFRRAAVIVHAKAALIRDDAAFDSVCAQGSRD